MVTLLFIALPVVVDITSVNEVSICALIGLLRTAEYPAPIEPSK